MFDSQRTSRVGVIRRVRQKRHGKRKTAPATRRARVHRSPFVKTDEALTIVTRSCVVLSHSRSARPRPFNADSPFHNTH